jgi:hypothetical protein
VSRLEHPAAIRTGIDFASPLQCVINAASGSSDTQAKREMVEAALRVGGRRGDLLFCAAPPG